MATYARPSSRPRSAHFSPPEWARRLSLPSPAGAANVATVGFLVTAAYQVLLAVGVVPITMAWGGSQSTLTTGLRVASLAAAAIMAPLIFVIRRRAAPRPPFPIKGLAWLISVLLALNTAGNLASRSRAEAMLLGPLTLVLTVSCVRVAAATDAPRPREDGQ